MAPKKIAQTVLTEGKFYTISAANGKVVEVADYNIDNGAKIQLMDNANFEWQQWNFVAAGDGVYRIQNRFTGKMMDLDMGGVSDGTRVHQCVGRDGCGYILRGFFVGDVDGPERDVMLLRGLLHLRHPVIGKGTLIGVVEDEAFSIGFRVLSAVLEFRQCCIGVEREAHEGDSTVRDICDFKSLVGQKLGVGEKFPLASLGAQNADALFALRSCIAEAFF